MIQIKNEIEKLYGFTPDDKTLMKLNCWKELFIEYNSHTNLMSKNDVKVLFEKHVVDSLSISLFDEFKNAKTLLDVGCGGGFPSLILAIFYPELNIFAIDSIAKKVRFLNLVKDELNLDNLQTIVSRMENIDPLNVDIITNRAVGKIADVAKFSIHHLKKNGYFVSYKSLTSKEEAKIAKNSIKNFNEPIFIPYNLPLSENYYRELVIFKKN